MVRYLLPTDSAAMVGLMTAEGGESLEERLAQPRWSVGYCRHGELRGTYVLLWPLLSNDDRAGWDGSGEAALAPEWFPDGADDGEDSYFFRREDRAAVTVLVRADIDWASDPHEIRRIVMREFPDSRAAEELGGQPKGRATRVFRKPFRGDDGR